MKRIFIIIPCFIVLVIILCVICLNKRKNIIMTPIKYEFVTMWGSKGSGDGEFGSAGPYWYKITDSTIEKLEDEFGAIILKRVEPLKNKEIHFNELVSNLFQVGFTNDEVGMIIDEAEPLDKPGINQLNGPRYIAVDTSGNVYVPDIVNDRIQKFGPDGNFIAKWGTRGLWEKEDDPDGVFNSLRGIATAANGDIYVSDGVNCRIQKFDSTGKFINKWPICSKTGKKEFPNGIAIDSNGKLYVCSTYIHIFSANGNFISSWSFPQPSFIESFMTYSYPNVGLTNRIALDEEDNLYITSLKRTYNFGPGVIKFTSSGKYIAKWGKPGKGSEKGQFIHPAGIATDLKGCIFIVDKGGHCIHKLTTGGKFVCKWGSEGSGDGEFLYPEDVAVDIDGNVYVMDSGNGRIQKFAPVPESVKEF